MDPLSVTASIVGILAAAGELSELLRSIISTAKDAPQVVAALVCEINEVQAALLSLQTLLTDLSSAPPRRAALIQLDHLIVTLTESVLTFSELEAIITPLAVSKGQKFPLRTRLKWTRIEGNCSKMVERLQRHKASISLMLNILQWYVNHVLSRMVSSPISIAHQMQKLVDRKNRWDPWWSSFLKATRNCVSD